MLMLKGKRMDETKKAYADAVRMSTWLAPNVEGAKPYVRTTSTADVWEFVWPDATGNGHDAVRQLRPADVADIIDERDQLLAKAVGERERQAKNSGPALPVEALFVFDRVLSRVESDEAAQLISEIVRVEKKLRELGAKRVAPKKGVE